MGNNSNIQEIGWDTEVDDNGNIQVPDELMPLFNKIATQVRFHTISGKEEVLTVADILWNAHKFFSNHPELLVKSEGVNNG